VTPDTNLTVAAILEAHRSGAATPAETVAACHARIRAHGDPAVFIALRKEADAVADAKAVAAEGGSHRPLYGVPIAIKDNIDVEGMPTTAACPAYAYTAAADATCVARLRRAGAIVIGKTNTPEFGAGSHTFNTVFGPTRNPADPSKSAGGSSGGAAAALASGMVPIADGSDLGGSLRNPASFCNVIGFRPTLAADADPLDLSVDGPMARSVQDAALLWSVMQPGELVDVRGSACGPRIAWSPACGGLFPVEPSVSMVVDATRSVFDGLGYETTEGSPDLAGVRDVFLTVRARSYAADLGELLADHRDEIKSTVVWNIEQGLALTDADVTSAVAGMRRLRSASEGFFERFDYLVQPVSQVPPFDADLEYPTEVAGEQMETYVDWMASCWSITVLGGPAISVPAGFTDEGLPIGLQIVGAPGDDAGVLRLAHAFEEATRFGAIRPPSA
jgi:amidase